MKNEAIRHSTAPTEADILQLRRALLRMRTDSVERQRIISIAAAAVADEIPAATPQAPLEQARRAGAGEDTLESRPVDIAIEDLARVPRRSTWVHATVAAVDITAFGCRDSQAQMQLRKAMYGCLVEAFAMTRLPWRDCHREDRGDGVLIVTPPGVLPEALMEPLAHHLQTTIGRHNRLASDTARLRLRMAVHTGQVHRDEHGVAGHTLVHVFRLLDAPAFKRAAVDADFSLIVSNQLYNDAIHNGGLVDPAAYRARRISYKETRTRAWIWRSPTNHRRA